MDPLSASMGAIGLATSVYGMVAGAQQAKQASAVQGDILAQEEHENQIRQQATHMQFQRQQIQNVRNVQRTQSMNKVVATQGGAQFGSGVEGGQAGAAAAGGWNALGLSNSIQSSDQMFATDAQIGMDKTKLASVDSTLATDKGIMGLGGSVMGSASSLGRLFGGGLGGGGPQGTDVTGGLFKGILS